MNRGTVLKTIMEGDHGQYRFEEIEGNLDFPSMRKDLVNVRKRLNHFLPGVHDSAECERLYLTLKMYGELGSCR